jgi:hypothetical protein
MQGCAPAIAELINPYHKVYEAAINPLPFARQDWKVCRSTVPPLHGSGAPKLLPLAVMSFCIHQNTIKTHLVLKSVREVPILCIERRTDLAQRTKSKRLILLPTLY